jgi:hypothetical protein
MLCTCTAAPFPGVLVADVVVVEEGAGVDEVEVVVVGSESK